MGSETSRVVNQANDPQSVVTLMTSELSKNSERGVASQEAFVDPTFPTELLSMFIAMASDSVALNGSQACHLQLVEALSKLLKTFVATRNVTGRDANLSNACDAVPANLKGMGDTFNVELIQTFEHLLHQNAELALKRQADLNTAAQFCGQLAKWLRLAVEAQVRRDKEYESCVAARTEAERTMRAVVEENERLSRLLAKCQETIKLWEDKKGVTLAANNLNDSICLWLSTLDGQLQSVDAKIQERDNRVAVLEAECLTQRLNAEELKRQAQQAQQDAVNARQTTVVALELGASGDFATATVFQVAPDGGLSQVGSSSLRVFLRPRGLSETYTFCRQVPFPYSRERPLAAAESSPDEPPPSPWPTAADLEAHCISLPSERAAAFAKYPDVAVTLPPEIDTPAIFSRDSISAILGGNWKIHHVVLGPTATDFAKRHSITTYTMSTVERNPWSPVRPGQHGYWFLPALEMKVPFKQNDKRHVFTGTRGGPYYYCGYYRITNFGELTLDEWLSLTHFHKTRYVRSFCAGLEDWVHYGASSVDDVIGKIDRGLFRVPCVQLQCVRFDVEFYKELCRENDRFFGEGGPDPDLQPAKRRRTASGGDERESELEQEEGQEE
ncbi:hypothetical protein LXA43DRAFT_979645 [Ganoderma leucocontextum]|nr:hypothetical protein LXA43DRAFT_979645 [Ganoderma leucocontextum]